MRLLDRSHIIKRLSVIAVMVTTILGAIIGVTQNSKKEAGAITQNGANVTVIQGQEIEYVGAGTGRWTTHRYSIQSGSSTYLGFCANPTKQSPTSDQTAILISSNARKYQKIKLAAYIYSVSNDTTNAILDKWFQPLPDTNLRYAFIHAIIGLLNDGTELALPMHWAETVSGELDGFIEGNSAVWQQASRYQLYELDLTAHPNYQNIMWIEPKPFGSIKVTKKDATTNIANPQGNASFNDIKFTVKKEGQIVKSCTLNNSNSCTISDLEYGDYTVSESAGNNTYQVDVNTTKPVTVNGGTEDVEFKNEVKKGSIKVRKKDSKMQDGVCKTTSGHSFNGITFGLYLDKSTKNNIYYGSQTYQPSGEPLIARKTIGQEGCEVTFDNLPIAKYYIKEISANNDYILSDEIKYAEITATNNSTAIEVEFSNAPTSLGTVATDKNDGDHYIEAQNNATIVDKVNYCVEPGRQYIIKGVLMDKSTGKELLIGGKKIESSAGVKPMASCGSATMEFVIDARELGGKDVVVFERLYEYKDDGNYENEDPIVKHENINDSKQTITIISLGTEAKDGIDDDKQILADKTAVVKDTISYCVKPGQKYTIRGTLIDKATGEPVLVNGNKVEGAMEIEPTEACGTAEMLFHFDATGMEGKEVVVFERLYIFKAETNDEGDPIIVHEDPNDEAQTVFIYLPPPNTGHFTSKEGDGQITGSILAPVVIITLVGGYGFYRATARKRFLRKR